MECDFEDQGDHDLGALDVNSSSVSCTEEHQNVAPPIVDFVVTIASWVTMVMIHQVWFVYINFCHIPAF